MTTTTTITTNLHHKIFEGQVGIIQGGYSEDIAEFWAGRVASKLEDLYLRHGMSLNCITGEALIDVADLQEIEELDFFQELEAEAEELMNNVTLD